MLEGVRVGSLEAGESRKGERYRREREEGGAKELGEGKGTEDTSGDFDSVGGNLTPIEELRLDSRRRGKRALSQKMAPRMVFPISDRKLPQAFKRAWADPTLKPRLRAKSNLPS